MGNQNTQQNETIERSLIDIVIASWNFSRAFLRLLKKLDAGERSKYISQYRYYIKSLESSLENVGYRLVNIEGQQYDPGIAATALNLDEFNHSDSLVVDQMLEPIIISHEGVIKSGTVILRSV